MADWTNGDDLARMVRGISPLEDAGYDPEEIRADPAMRSQVIQQLRSPYGLQPRGQSTIGRTAPPQASQQPASGPAGQRPVQVAAAAPVAMPKPTGAGTSTVAPSGGNAIPAAPGFDAMTMDALRKGMQASGEEETAAEKLANTDDGTAQIEAQRVQDATPTPLYGPDGKMLDQYKPSVGKRILRGLRGGVVGLMTGGIPGAVVGALEPQDIRGGSAYGAPNEQYQQAEGQRIGRLASDDQQLQAAKDRFKALTDARKAGSTGLGSAITGYGNVAKDATGAQNAQTNLQKSLTQLREHGLKLDDQGNTVPLSYDEMTPDQQSIYDLRQAQTELASARADVEKTKNDPNSPAGQMAQQRLRIAELNAQTAVQRLGLSRQEFQFNQDKFYNPQPTGTERTRGDLAQSAVDRVNEMRAIVDKHPEIFGPGAGRGQKLSTWIGSQDPDAQTFQSAAMYLADHSAGVFGARSHETTEMLRSLTDPHSNPAALKAALDEAQRTAQHFVKAGQVHGRPSEHGAGNGGGGKDGSRPASGGEWEGVPEAQ